MKKICTLLVILCVLIKVQAASQTLISSTDKGLLYAIKQQVSDLNAVTDLVISDTIDASDFTFMRDSLPQLSSLDLGDARIVAYSGDKGPSVSLTSYPANTIPSYAFCFNTNVGHPKLSTVVFPATVTTIQSYAFYNCASFSSLNIGDNISSIEPNALAACPCKFSVSATNLNYKLVGESIYSYDGTTFIQAPTTISGIFTVASSVVQINEKAFAWCKNMTAIDMPATVNNIGDYAFLHCEGLTKLPNPTSLTSYREGLFSECNALIDVTIPSNITSIGIAAFLNAYNLKSIIIPKTVTSIGENVLSGCGNLVTVDLKASITSLPAGMFNYCIKLPAIVIPSGVTSISESAFYYCRSLKSVSIPLGVTSISGGAFQGCESLTKIVLPPSVRWIYDYAFQSCTKLETIILPASLDSPIGFNAFANCSSLRKVFSGLHVPISISDASLSIHDSCVLYVPKGAKANYLSAAYWKNFKRIVEYPLLSDDTIHFDVNGGIKTVSLNQPNAVWQAYTPYYIFSVNNYSATSSIIVTASKNTYSSVFDGYIVAAIGDYSQRIPCYIDLAISPKKQFTSQTLTVDKPSVTFKVADYFDYKGSTPLSFSVQSSNPAVVFPVLKGGSLGLVAYKKGEALVYVIAKSIFGATDTLSFSVIVSSQLVTTCNISINETIKQISCAGKDDASISVLATGGHEPYFYKWSTTCSDSKAIDLSAGLYRVVVSDTLGCSASKVFTITEPQPLRLSVLTTNSTCKKSNASIVTAVWGGSSNYTYKWSQGATTSSLTNIQSGIYSLTVTDANACTLAETVAVSDSTAPDLNVDSIRPSNCSKLNGAVFVNVFGNKASCTYAWSNSQTTQNISSLKAGNYSLTVTNANGCKSHLNITVPAKQIKRPQIDLVSVSDSSHKNIVVWRKEQSDAIDYYTIHRETSRGTYIPVGKLKYNDLSVFVDTANPQKKSSRYRITATDFCQNQTLLSKEYKTMHIKHHSRDSSTIDLAWDDYEGSGFYSFVVYRMNLQNNWEAIDSLPASVKRFTDKNADKGLKSYRIGIVFDSVFPNRFKSDTGPFSQSLSNMSEVSLVNTNVSANVFTELFPNPANHSFTVRVSGYAKVSVLNLMGQIVAQQQGRGSIEINSQQFVEGLYLVKVETSTGVVTKSVLIKR